MIPSLHTRRPRGDGGWVLVTSMIVMMLILSLGVTLLNVIDNQTGQNRTQRTRETAFNVAEAGLNAQIFSLSRDWPGQGMATNPYPTCSAAVTSTRCPSNAQLVGLIPSADLASGASWQTVVRDNGPSTSANFYSDSLVLAQPAYDANGDDKLWVRSTATARGKSRTVVALVSAQEQEEDIPHSSVISGRLDISNQGNKIIIDATSGAGGPAAAVRCTPALSEPSSCLGHILGQPPVGSSIDALQSWLGRQVSPNNTQYGYTGGDAMTDAARARLKATAIAKGTYYTSCPPSLAGDVVYIEAGDCSYVGNDDFNSDAHPGMVLMATGTLYLGGTVQYHGIIYHANRSASSGTVIQIQGNAQVFGGVLIDGQATLIAGSSKVNVVLDPNAFRAVASYGSAGVVQNTWRELR